MKEIDVIKTFVAESLNDSENQALKSFLGSEDSYTKFLDKLVKILIEQDKTITLSRFLDLHNLSGLHRNLSRRKEEIITEIAELSAGGYASEITQWLQQSKNETYLNHLNFIRDTKTGIKITEREALKKKLVNMNKMDAFPLSETEIKAGIKAIERKKLKEKLRSFEKHNQTNTAEKGKFKYSALFLFIIASTFVLAISIPTVRNFIKQEFHKVFYKEQPAALANEMIPKENKQTAIGDTAKPIVYDTLAKPIDTSSAIKKQKRVFLGGTKSKSITAYKNYFIKHKADLDSIEGIWTIKEKNSKNYTCAIFKVSEQKYELRYFSQNGTWEKADHTYYFKAQANSKNYRYSEYLENKLIGNGVLRFVSPASFRCKYDYSEEFLQALGAKKGAKAHFILTAHKNEREGF
ncbi:MAG: hypothetical protein JST67_05305 [Bacteroidetes bacterium]|nr:hypothetical protein [Bacteroidota bacterium]